MHCFSSEVPMTLGSKLYGKFSINDTTRSSGISSLAEGHEARLQIASDVMARDWQWRNLKHHPSFWVESSVQEELSRLHDRAQSIDLNLQAYMLSARAPHKGTWEYYSICMDMLHITCILAVIQLMPVPPEEHPAIAYSTDFQNSIVRKMVQYGEEMHAVHASLGWPPPDISLETSIIGPMYWVYVYSTQPRFKKRAMKILQETKQREGPWDAKQTLTLLTADEMRHSNRGMQKDDQTHALRKWGGESNCYE
jgi:hypothetical protein